MGPPNMPSDHPSPELFTVGWICATTTGTLAATQFLDVQFENYCLNKPKHDTNDYVLGRIKDHNVVIASLPDGEQGQNPAATVARNLVHTFHNIRIGLMVGLGGGVPSEKNDIRLGDIVVSSPGEGTGGVVQYDFGIATQNQGFQETGHLNNPPQLVRTAVSGLKAHHMSNGNGIEGAVDVILRREDRLAHTGFGRPDASLDKLFEKHVVHTEHGGSCCKNGAAENKPSPNHRADRGVYDDNPAIHYGIIASSGELIRDAKLRDELATGRNIMCFEREAAGLMNHFGCLIIRGINTYADSHGNTTWDKYASLTAAAYAKALLQRIAANKIEELERIDLSRAADTRTGAENT